MGAYFGRRAFGTVYGLAVGLGQVGVAVAPALTGWISDVTAEWLISFGILAIAYLLGSIAMYLAVPPKQQTRERVRAEMAS